MTLDNMTGITEGSYTGFCKSQLITCNRVKECNGVCPFEDALKHADKEMDEQTVIDHDRDWIIGCIEHDGFIHTQRFDKANQIILDALSAVDRPTTDCTKFLEWLKAEVLDEENWELNAVANGEIICRKFRKLGWLDVEYGYYVDTRPTVDKEYLIDLIQESVDDGEACAKLIDLVDRPTGEMEGVDNDV